MLGALVAPGPKKGLNLSIMVGLYKPKKVKGYLLSHLATLHHRSQGSIDFALGGAEEMRTEKAPLNFNAAPRPRWGDVVPRTEHSEDSLSVVLVLKSHFCRKV